MTWYADSVTAPARARPDPSSDAADCAQSAAAMRAAPASATAMAAATAGATASPSTRREKARVKRGAVLTSRTEAATEVKDRLAIQVAKCRPRATPEAIIARRRRDDRIGHA